MACSRVELIGVANKNALFAMLVGLIKRFEAQRSQFFNEFERFVELTSHSDT